MSNVEIRSYSGCERHLEVAPADHANYEIEWTISANCQESSLDLLMNQHRLTELETAIGARSPLMVSKFQPGLTESQVRSTLESAGAKGAIEPILRLHTWKNGTSLDRELAAEQFGLFPGETLFFTELEQAVADFEFFRQAIRARPKIAEAVGRYFPFLWNESTTWIAVDLTPGNQSRVLLIDLHSDHPIHELYPSFDQFVTDLIRANKGEHQAHFLS